MRPAAGGMEMKQGNIACECGNEVSFSENNGRVECDCGRRYVVTVTQISS